MTIALAVSLLIAYGFYSFHDYETKLLLSTGSFLFLATTLFFSIATVFEQQHSNSNIRVVSVIFFVVALISNLIFSVTSFSIPSYIVVNGILLLIFLLTINSIHNVKQ